LFIKIRVGLVRENKGSMSDTKTVLRDIGALFMIMGFVTLIALVVPLYFGEYGPNSPFDTIGYILVTSAVFFVAWQHSLLAYTL
jgi:hypothetical protein